MPESEVGYWSDKKSAIKKKVAAHSAARRRTGGGVEDEVELSELEERVVALCGGESYSTGDAHLGIQPFPDSNLIEDNQEQSHNYRPPDRAILRRRLFASSSSSTVGTSQSILRNNQLEHTPPPNPHVYHPSLSPPTVTLSHTPTPSPSRRGSTQVASPVIHRTAASSSSRNAASVASRNAASVASRNAASVASRNAASVASPSRRPRTVRGSRGGSVSSRHTSSITEEDYIYEACFDDPCRLLMLEFMEKMSVIHLQVHLAVIMLKYALFVVDHYSIVKVTIL
ncbi:hypothetical protein PYW08_006500 [Mythimna loreyi]|uniref:Uncharacterized protein n=1 Tax=Mythimna loreyi TaxID=667449 RepID=A0ACC2QRW0_9NEOP|nr:hypothetical protein PYW08_006500 [Mythimna loreyi]